MPTKKIADLPRVCRHPEHNPPNMMVYQDGVWEHVCPACGARKVFTISNPRLVVRPKRQPFRDIEDGEKTFHLRIDDAFESVETIRPRSWRHVRREA